VLVAFWGCVVIAVRGDYNPFAVGEGDERGDFFAGRNVPEAGGAVR